MAKKDTKTNNIVRENWGRKYSIEPQLDLLAAQKQSYKWFEEKAIGEILHEISPIDDFTEKNWTLSLTNYRLGKTTNDPVTALAKGLTFDAPLYVKAILTNKKTGKNHTAEVFLGDIPQMTDRGTFIINGIERAVVNQLVRSDLKAILTNKKTGKNHTAEVFLGDIPQMTDRGTFIINGIERAVVNQLVR